MIGYLKPWEIFKLIIYALTTCIYNCTNAYMHVCLYFLLNNYSINWLYFSTLSLSTHYQDAIHTFHLLIGGIYTFHSLIGRIHTFHLLIGGIKIMSLEIANDAP